MFKCNLPPPPHPLCVINCAFKAIFVTEKFPELLFSTIFFWVFIIYISVKSGKIGSCLLGVSYWQFRLSTFLIRFLFFIKEIQLLITKKRNKLEFDP